MNDKPVDVARIQGWMQAVITHPEGIRAGVASAEARQEIDIEFEDVEKVVSRSEALTGAERLTIYSRSYHARLLECFRAEFPCLLHALGNQLFDDFVIEYLKCYPPQSYTLHDVAKNFTRFLTETRPDGETWPDFIIDLATFERTFIEVFDGAGSEGERLASAGLISDLDDEQLSQLRLAPVPCLRLLAFRYPVLAYFYGVREKSAQEKKGLEKKGPEMPAPSETFLAVHRKNYGVHFSPLSSLQHSVLESLMAGLCVDQALTRAADLTESDRKQVGVELRAWLRRWVDAGFFLQ